MVSSMGHGWMGEQFMEGKTERVGNWVLAGLCRALDAGVGVGLLALTVEQPWRCYELSGEILYTFD